MKLNTNGTQLDAKTPPRTGDNCPGCRGGPHGMASGQGDLWVRRRSGSVRRATSVVFLKKNKQNKNGAHVASFPTGVGDGREGGWRGRRGRHWGSSRSPCNGCARSRKESAGAPVISHSRKEQLDIKNGAHASNATSTLSHPARCREGRKGREWRSRCRATNIQCRATTAPSPWDRHLDTGQGFEYIRRDSSGHRPLGRVMWGIINQ